MEKHKTKKMVLEISSTRRGELVAKRGEQKVRYLSQGYDSSKKCKRVPHQKWHEVDDDALVESVQHVDPERVLCVRLHKGETEDAQYK